MPDQPAATADDLVATLQRHRLPKVDPPAEASA
jgi:hypothetical protein